MLDLTKERYPFEDRSVDAVFSAHFLEHIEEPNHVFGEIGRICKDGAKIEFWTPYAFTNEAFVYGHLHFLTEETGCTSAPRTGTSSSGCSVAAGSCTHRLRHPARGAVSEIEDAGFSLDFAVKYMKGVANEFGVEIEFRRTRRYRSSCLNGCTSRPAGRAAPLPGGSGEARVRR